MNRLLYEEKTVVEEAVKEGKLINISLPRYIPLLCRYYLGEGFDYKETANLIKSFFSVNMRDKYIPKQHDPMINRTAKDMYNKGFSPLEDVTQVRITEKEWANILELEEETPMKIAFVLLVHLKVKLYKNPDGNNRVYTPITDILKESGLPGTLKDKKELQKLRRYNFIKRNLTANEEGIELAFLDEDRYSPVKFYVTNFVNVASYFKEYYKGWAFKECPRCHKRFKYNDKKVAPTYCKVCKCQVNKEKQKAIYRKRKYGEDIE